jgi:small subunit ribosomal protein S21
MPPFLPPPRDESGQSPVLPVGRAPPATLALHRGVNLVPESGWNAPSRSWRSEVPQRVRGDSQLVRLPTNYESVAKQGRENPIRDHRTSLQAAECRLFRLGRVCLSGPAAAESSAFTFREADATLVVSRQRVSPRLGALAAFRVDCDERQFGVVKLTLRDKETAQEAVRRFRKLVERSGIKKEIRVREFYEKPSETKRRARLRAERRAKRDRLMVGGVA